jgi:hypothetical protein
MNFEVLLLIGALVVTALVLLVAKKGKKAGTTGSRPVEEAEVFLAYGRKKDAKTLLEKHLQTTPNDEKAMQLLRKCQ